MPQLRQLVIAAEDPGRLAAFYQEVFELEKIEEAKGAVFLSDGAFNLALVPEAEPHKQGLRHLSFETVRVESLGKKLVQAGAQESELIQVDTITGVEYEQRPVPIRHIALYTPDPQRMADYYCKVLDMKEVEKTDRSSVFVSDGYFNLALLYQRKEEPIGLNHFGFHVKSNEEMQARAEKAGVRRGAARPERIPFAEYRVHDPEGNGIDISQKGWRV